MSQNHPGITVSYSSIAAAYYGLKDYDKALEYYKKCLEIGLQDSEKNAVCLAASYTGINQVYEDLDDYEKAMNYLIMAFTIQCKIYKHSHPDTLTLLKRIIAVAKKPPFSPRGTLEKIYILCVQTLGPEHELTQELSQLIGS